MATDDNQSEETEPKPRAVYIPPHAPLPVGTAPLLDAQLGEALKIMRDYACLALHPNSSIRERLNFGDALARLMAASAPLAMAAARFATGNRETRHRMIVEYVPSDAPKGQGSQKFENE